MPKTGGTRRPLRRTQKSEGAGLGAVSLETRARAILSDIVKEVSAKDTDLQMPEEPAAELLVPPASAARPDEDAQPVDELPITDLTTIAREGASLEVDGARHDVVAMVALAESVADDAHLKICNSGTFTAEELALIARSSSGQVIFA